MSDATCRETPVLYLDAACILKVMAVAASPNICDTTQPEYTCLFWLVLA